MNNFNELKNRVENSISSHVGLPIEDIKNKPILEIDEHIKKRNKKDPVYGYGLYEIIDGDTLNKELDRQLGIE